MSDQVFGAGQQTLPPSPYQIQVSYGASQNPTSSGIARGTGADWFGPLNPLAPIAPPDVAGRRFDFPPGYNLNTRPRAYEPIGFHELRAFADAYDLLRLVIETRKDQMERQRWRIRPRTSPFRSSPASGGGLGRGRGAALDADTQARVAAVEHFFHKPDGVTRWKTWLRALLEDMFVIDAATLFCQRTRSGQLFALHQLDGATIKRVIDDWGRTPQPFSGDDGTVLYPPAYQQVLKGMPAVNYSARDIIYRPRNVRAHKVYGYSPVQQVLMTVNIALRRQLWQLDYFSEGSIPDALIGVPGGWTPDQIKQFQDYWDTEFAGDLARRRRAKFVPGDSARTVHQTKEPDHKDDFDEWLARIICFAFSVPPQWAVKLMNRATADNQSAQSEEEGLEPTKEWVKDLVDEIIAAEFASPDLELHWLDEDADPAQTEAALEGRVKLGAVTLNEMRDHLGLDPYANAAADRPMVLTPTGYVPIEANAGGENASTQAGPPIAEKRSLSKDYDPDQPRVPAGQAGAGQWTSEGADGSASDSKPYSTNRPDSNPNPGVQYAALDTGTWTDATEVRPTGQENATVQYAATNGVFWATRNPLIDKTSVVLLALLNKVTDGVGPRVGLSPTQYGTKIHTEFAAAVKAEGLTGVEVEQTFGLDPEDLYGAEGSIRTDMLLRDDEGNIIAIWDVKTGETRLKPWRVRELRAMTDTTSGTYVFELNVDRGVTLKYRHGELGLRLVSPSEELRKRAMEN